MKVFKYLCAIPLFVIATIFFINCPVDINAASGRALSFANHQDNADTVFPSRSPHYISMRMHYPDNSFIASENGVFQLEAILRSPTGSAEEPPRWDNTLATPLVILISSPEDSGIAFIDRLHPDRPRHHIMVKLGVPVDQTASTLTTQVQYHVNPRTSAGSHSFWVDISGDLIKSDGNKFHDAGIMRFPFKVDTHLNTKLLMLTVIAVVVFFFIVEWVRVDVVAIAMMVLLPELGLLRAQDTFRGLSSNAVIAIIGVMIISYGLNRSGLVHRIVQPLLNYVGRSPHRMVVMFSSLIAVISSVMQNTGAAVLFLPAIRLATSYRLKIHISRVLMPIGMAAILGGTLTMIGTSPLILLNDILPPSMPKFSFLELTPIGLALVIGGIAYLSLIGLRMLSRRAETISNSSSQESNSSTEGILKSYPMINGPFEIYVPVDYQPGSLPQSVVQIRRQFSVNIVASAHINGTCEIAPLPEDSIRPDLRLCVYGPTKAVRRFVDEYKLDLRQEPQYFKGNMFNPSLAGIVEGVVSPRSSLIGKTIREIRFRETFGLNPLAIHQSGKTYYRQLADRPLQAGDAILINGTWEQLHTLEDFHRNFIIITPYEKEFHKPEKSRRALICFIVALFLMVLSSFYFQTRPYNPIPLSVCLMIGAIGMVLTKVISINEAYHAVDWRTVFLLGGLIPLGMAMDQTGTAAWLAGGIVAGLGSFMTPLLLLVVLAVLSCLFTMVISNVGACTLLIPLGISLANQIGVDPRVAAIVVGLGVSNSFILPTHQVNALYMGPGEYKTRDYISIGGILAIVYIVILVTMTYFFYM